MPIPKPTTLKYDFIKKSKAKPQPDGYILRSAYGTAIPISKSGYYQFKSSTNNAIEFRVSRLARDWPVFSLSVQLSAFANAFVTFSQLWLKSHGYGDVRIVFVDGYVPLGQSSAYDNQKELRQKIMSDFISLDNADKPMSEWKGIKPKPVDLASTIIRGSDSKG
jgi:hypothetical protein